MNHPPNYSFTHQLIYSFTHTILSIYAIGKNSPRIFAFSACSAVRRIGQSDKKMQNEPNPVLSEVEWISKVTHLINEQQTMNNEQLSNEPNLQKTINKQFSNEPNFKNPQIRVKSFMAKNYANFHPLDRQKNEPNLCNTKSINNSLIYPFTHLLINAIMQNEPNPVLSEVEWISKVTHLINEQRTMNNKQFSNEPNFKNTKIRVKPLNEMGYANFRPRTHQKNEPNYRDDLSIVACRQRRWNPIQT